MQSIQFKLRQIPQPNQQVKNQKKWVNYIEEYSEMTTLHGFRYIAESGRSLVERLCWIFLVSLSLFCLYSLTLKVYEKWKINPIVVTFNGKSVHISSIPSPAITICPEGKYSKERFNFTDLYLKTLSGNISAKEKTNFYKHQMFCKHFLNENKFDTEYSENFDDDDLQMLVNDTKKILVHDLTLTYRYYYYNRYLLPILTDEGVCYTFNSLNSMEVFHDDVINFKEYGQFVNRSEWTLDGGYLLFGEYPLKMEHAGMDSGFIAWVASIIADDDLVCAGPVRGMKIMLHLPHEWPLVFDNYKRVPAEKTVNMVLRTQVAQSSEELKTLSVDERNCYFESERELRYFKQYTAMNCRTECFTNFTLSLCNCLPYFLPRTSSTPLCGIKSFRCIQAAKREAFGVGTNNMLQQNNTTIYNKCNCLPTCNSIEYTTDVYQEDYLYKKFFSFNEEEVLYPQQETSSSVIKMFYLKEEIVSTLKSKVFDDEDFIATGGGIFGICIGFSVLSVLELLFFATLRIVCNKWLEFQENSSNKSKEQH